MKSQVYDWKKSHRTEKIKNNFVNGILVLLCFIRTF